MLHLIVQGSVDKVFVERLGVGDDIVLQQSAVFVIAQGHDKNALILRALQKACSVYVLKDELDLFGLLEEQILSDVKVIDYSNLVELTVKHKAIKTWR